MVERWVSFALILLLVPTLIGAELPYSSSQTYTLGNGFTNVDFGVNEQQYNKITVDYDLEITDWRTDLPQRPNNARYNYNLFCFQNSRGDCLFSHHVRATQIGTRGMLVFPTLDNGGDETKKSVPFTTGNYHFTTVFDGTTGTATTTITGAVSVTHTVSIGSLSLNDMNKAFSAEMSIDGDQYDYYIYPKGWKVSNINVVGELGVFTPFSGGSGGTDSGGYNPGETDVHFGKDGGTYPGPWIAPGDDVLVLETPSKSTGYSSIAVEFDFIPQMPTATDVVLGLFRLDNACSGKFLMSSGILIPDTGSERSIFKARGLDTPSSMGAILIPGEEYRINVLLDLTTEQATYSIQKLTDGGTIASFSGPLNSDSNNLLKASHTTEGLKLSIGAKGTNKNWYKTGGWEFSNIQLILDGEAGDDVSSGADMGTDEGRLAFLAASMIGLTDENEFSLDCGPAEEILNLPPANTGEYFCVLSMDDEVIFGTFGVGEQAAKDILESFRDPIYAAHVKEDEIHSDACDAVLSAPEEWGKCPNAIEGMSVYTLPHALSGTVVLVVSQNDILAFNTGLLNGIVDFFKDLFGLGKGPTTVKVAARKFHHGFFLDREDRQITATWYDSDAILSYEGFWTDFSSNRPQNSKYHLGQKRQVVVADLNQQAPGDVNTWRSMTAGLRVKDNNQPPMPGDECGNGIVGFDEECEPGVTKINCSDIDPTTPAVPVVCNDECILEIGACYPDNTNCGDDWVPPGDWTDPTNWGCGGDQVCLCKHAFWDAVRGIPIENLDELPGRGGAISMFQSGGSENIPVLCNAARYIISGEQDWFNGYYDYQLTNGDGRGSYFMGTEIFSPTAYTGMIVSPNLAVYHEAKRRGHSTLSDKASQWLTTHFVMQALGSASGTLSAHNVFGHPASQGPASGNPGPAWNACGYVVSMAGSRSKWDSLSWHHNRPLFSWAMGSGACVENVDLENEGAWWTTSAQVAMGYANGGAISEADMGLKEGTRALMASILALNNPDDYDAVYSVYEGIKEKIGDHKPTVPFTFVRTANGVVTWMGTYEQSNHVKSVNGNKGTVFAASYTGNTLQTLYPFGTSLIGKHGEAWFAPYCKDSPSDPECRDGNYICATGDGGPYCMPFDELTDSGIVYAMEWNNEAGLVLHLPQCPDGNCGACDPECDICCPGPNYNEEECDSGCSWQVAASPGAYDILVRVAGEDEYELKVEKVRDSDGVPTTNPTCDLGDAPIESGPVDPGLRTGDFGPHSSKDKGVVDIYFRQHHPDVRWDTRIELTTTNDRWVINGVTTKPDGTPLQTSDAAAGGRRCWCPPDTVYCENMNIQIPFADVKCFLDQECSEKVSGTPDGTGDGCGLACSESEIIA
ncbi:hypothetical protein GOV11_01935 [Candidatus Woesearchaeota archaeon]|nr:hypothetical protein [Candidatus Woesearchaeota archaeon]